MKQVKLKGLMVPSYNVSQHGTFLMKFSAMLFIALFFIYRCLLRQHHIFPIGFGRGSQSVDTY